MALMCISLIACKKKSDKNNETQVQNNTSVEQIVEGNLAISGTYVDDIYAKKAEGYDWVGVIVEQNEDNSVSVSVRSRADLKKPTCTFDSKAFKINETSYEASYDGKNIIFKFTGANLAISTKIQENSNMLYFFCNGGATLGGTYKKIDGDLDPEQVDKTSFSKSLNLQDIGFNVSSIMKDGKNTLTVYAYGLEVQNYDESFSIEGEKVIDVEVEDLNSDGSPELFVYTQSVGSGSYGNVYAFSVNNKKSMSPVYFQPTAENRKVNQGYMGHNEFSLVENTLSQRFPIYKEGDTNADPTGGTRQVSYKLVEGEAMRKLEVETITEY